MLINGKIVTIFALAYLANIQQTKAKNILAFLPSFSPSHLIIEMAVAKAMAEREHNVTVVSTLPLKSEWLHPGMTHIQLDKVSVDIHNILNMTKMSGFQKLRHTMNIMQEMTTHTAAILDDLKFQELLNNPGNQFDLMLYGYLFNDYFFGIAEHFDCPVALIWPNIPLASILNLIGSPLEISYTVSTMLFAVNDDSIGFKFRLKNLLSVGADLFLSRIQDREMQKIYEKAFPATKYPSYDKAKDRVAMVLFSHHFSEKPIRPLVPALIEIGGIHINDPPKNLTKDIEDFINSAAHGVIFFSLGTNIKQQHLRPHALSHIYNVLSKLPQKVLWKVDDETKVPGKASNILYRKWLPQADILGHSNIKLFFGHGGKGGITEASYFGVPIVGMPMFGDQPMNMDEVVRKGYGLSINHDETLSEEIISKTVTEVLENPFYANNVKRFSSLYRDRPLKAKETAVYWLEYLLRYNGAPHMQSPLRKISFIESMNLDVLAFILFILFVSVKIFKLLLRTMCKLYVKLVYKKSKRE